MHPDPESFSEPAIQALAADLPAVSEPSSRRRHWLTALYLTTLLVSLPMLGHSAWQFAWFAGVRRVTDPRAASNSQLPNILRRLNRQQELLLFGDLTAAREAERWQPLWASAPDNPAYLSEYAAAFFSEHKKLSPAILVAAGRIDPDNGWLPALAAAGSAAGAVAKAPLTYEERKAGTTPVLKINDEGRLRQTLELIHQAAAKPRFTTYQTELLRQRIPLLPPRKDYVSQIPAMAYAASQRADTIHLLKLNDVLSAGARQCAARQDPAGFRQITGDWMNLVQATSHGGDTMIELLVAKSLFSNPLPHFRDAAQTLGLDEEARHFAQVHERVKADKEALKQRGRTSSLEALVRHHGSIFASLGLPVMVSKVANPPAITEADLRPGRYAEHALFERAGSLVAWLLLGLCAGGAALKRYRQNPHTNLLSIRMLDLLHPADRAWILLGGVLLPVLWYLLITRLTPLGAREWPLIQLGLFQALGQAGSLLAWMILFPPVIASWRLGQRGAAFGLATHRQWPAWLAAGCAALAIPTFGAMMIGPSGMLLNLASGLLGIAVLWLLAGLGRNVFGRPAHALRRATLARLVLPAWILGMLVCALAVPLHYAGERYWIQQDHLLEISAESPSLSRYEYAVTQVLRAELLEQLRTSGMVE